MKGREEGGALVVCVAAAAVATHPTGFSLTGYCGNCGLAFHSDLDAPTGDMQELKPEVRIHPDPVPVPVAPMGRGMGGRYSVIHQQDYTATMLFRRKEKLERVSSLISQFTNSRSPNTNKVLESHRMLLLCTFFLFLYYSVSSSFL